MTNEALISRNQSPAYSDSDLELFENGLDPDLFPNVNWMDLILKDGAPTYHATIDLTGGGTVARYFISASYVNEGGMYETDRAMKDYNTNANYHRWNYRMNTDIDLTKTTLLKVGVSGSLEKQNLPGSQYWEIWQSLMGYNPIYSPVRYSDGKWPGYNVGDHHGGGYRNPWVATTQQGYQETWGNKLQTTVNLEQDFSFITPGLKFYGRFGFDTSTENGDNRYKWPESWVAQRQRTSDGELQFTRVETEQLMNGTMYSNGERKEYLEAELHYDRSFGDHMVGAIMKYTQDKTTNTSENKNSNSYDKIVQSIQNRHQGLAGRFTYGWKYRYFFDFNFGYNGSENFATGEQFGFFPAYSVAWNIAEEGIVKKHLPWLSLFKLRYSYGKVGNDDVGTRFPYIQQFTEWSGSRDDADNIGNKNGYYYGDIGTSNYFYPGLTFARLASNNITWEIAKKHDLGLDFSILNEKFTGTVDYFHEKRDGIFMQRNFLPYYLGLNHIENKPNANVGSVLSKGFDGNIAYMQKIGEVNLTIRANMTYSKNEIKDYDTENSHFPYKNQIGFRVNQARGLIAEGLFKDYEEIRNCPRQDFGEYMPGDIKYKDVNGDGVINSDDEVPIGSTTRPNLIYGFGVSALWKGFDFNVHFQGAGKSSFCIDGFTVYPFVNGSWGNILTDVVGNYWSLGTNEDPNAKYPRLSYGGNANNYRNSTYWLRDGSYLRLKNVEIGYTIPQWLVNKIHIGHVRIYLRGTNLLTFSSFDLWDPELGSSNGQAYPLSKTVTLGLTLGI